MPGGWVHEFILENFKSYEGRVRIGPLRRFTCIVGPNGAGKSNLLEAIAFVLHVRQSRGGERLLDIVHRKERDPSQPQKQDEQSQSQQQERALATSVELVYASDLEFEDGDLPMHPTQIIAFRRFVVSDTESGFQIDGQVVSEDVYLRRLEGINILSKAKNFLIFQGDVETAAQRQGRDLTNFFEQISGSSSKRCEYERLSKEKSKLEEDFRRLYIRKRNAQNERRLMVHQKSEAEKYQRQLEEKRELQLQFALFRLQGLAQIVAAEESKRVEAQRERLSREEQYVATRHEAEAMNKELREQLQPATGRAVKDADIARSRLDQAGSEQVAFRTKLAVAQSRLEELQREDSKAMQQASQLEQQVVRLRQEEASLVKTMSEDKEILSGEMPFTAAQREQFEQAQEASSRLTASSRQQVRDLEAQFHAVVRGRTRAECDVREATSRREHLRQRVLDLVEVESQAEAALKREASIVAELDSRIEVNNETRSILESERQHLVNEREDILRSVEEIAATERQLARNNELRRVVTALKRLFPGVQGRLIELCRPAQKQMKVPLNVALGGFLDAIVTDTTHSAQLCVQHLKDNTKDAMTFVPMDHLRMPEPNARLRTLVQNNHSLHYALNCISCESRFVRVFEFLLNDVVIAESMEVGREFFFTNGGAHIGCRVVTLEGETISHHGNISVSSDASRDSGTRFDFDALEIGRDRLEGIERRLPELSQASAVSGNERDRFIEMKRAASEKERSCDRKLQQCRAELEARKRELQRTCDELDALRSKIEGLAREEADIMKEQEFLEESICQSVSVYFQKLSSSMGVDDILKAECEWRRRREAARLRVRDSLQQLDCVRAELASVGQASVNLASSRTATSVADGEAAIERLHAEAAKADREADALKMSVADAERRARDASDEERKAEKGLARYRHMLSEEHQRIADAEKRTAELTSQLEALADAQLDILNQCMLEGVQVPMLNPSAEIDFRRLSPEKVAAATGPAAQLLEEEFRVQIRQNALDLERARPNLKAFKQLKEITNHAERCAKEAAVAHAEIEKIRTKFEKVRHERRELFMGCFERVSDEVSHTYKRLTGHAINDFEDGGSAYLDLEDLEDPFSGGVRFTAIPPGKRFCDIGLLSGGEQALAALALIFAIQAHQRPPFLVLDEVDAHLDTRRVRALATYVERSAKQMLVISLRDVFFTRSQALVGVSKDRRTQSSVAFTLDLNQFRSQTCLGTRAALPSLATGSGAPEPLPTFELERSTPEMLPASLMDSRSLQASIETLTAPASPTPSPAPMSTPRQLPTSLGPPPIEE
eukprot:TRINITY_DN29720_c0_g1_i1.p1 TRINITY_DN29720_c0_g1~~TRINITY_DN29720_c0_g1_i1.p1  ORF type:complete len:1303 (-),score=285.99 TRINITY_DN29720_c0_g1_i1:36-3944(-)